MAQINKPDEYFNTVLYTGNGSTQSITGVNFQPDFIWNKQRNGTYEHYLFNAITGTGKFLKSNSTDAEGTNTDTVTSFDSDGFSLGSAAGNNGSGNTMVSWNWLASNTTASNTDGSITSTVSANTTSGFSIVSWTGNATAGATIGHGLGSVPKMIIVRNRTDVEDWVVYHGANTSAPETDYLVLNLTNATGDSSGVWNDTAPTSSVFSVGTANSTNGSSDNMIAYCFAEKKGFSKFGSYTGNGNADGTFVYTGFKPAWVMIKQTNTTGNWAISDNQRLNNSGNQDGGKGNYVPHMLAANSSNPESNYGGGSSNEQDYLSNGFKLRSSNTYANQSGGSYIYMAFAESPLVGTNNIPAVAR